MNRCTIALSSVALATAAHAGLIDPNLEAVMRDAAPDQVISTLVYLTEQVDTSGITAQLDAQRATLRDRHESVVCTLQDVAAGTQGDLLDYLEARRNAGAVAGFRAFWISNVIHVEATAAEITAIADRIDVDWVYYDYELELIEPVATRFEGGAAAGGVPEPGVEAVRAPEVWEMGITGQGVLVATLDTGVDGAHPALASRWRGVADPRYAGNPEWAWFDPVTNTTFPQAFGSHGTHTMGSVCGGAPGDAVGVAPGAEWIHAATIDRVSISRTVSDSLLAFEWLLDPDENPATNWDVPAVCSNSWGLVTSHGYPPCDQTFWNHLDACEAAGIVILFSAGNEGTSGLRRPADRATDDYRTAAVAAVDANNPSWPIASFSSRGPTNCTPGGESAIKPDIAAPGVSVRSSIPGGGYGSLSGTSMASPHVNGVVALMREANPDLAVEQVKQIIYDTAFDLGATGEDNAYGWGMIDAFEAVQAAIAQSTLRFTFLDEFPVFVDPTGGTRIRVIVSGEQNEPEPGTGKLYYATADVFTEVPMEELEPNTYDAVFPAFDCGDHVRYYFSAETTEGDVIFNPFTAPDATYAADAYTGTNVFFADDFESDRGWTVEDSPGLTSGTWERGVPLGGDRGNPSRDSDGSGQCYVTGRGGDDNDIDDGSTVLTSPAMDASDADAVLSYDRWYSNTFGADPENDVFVIEVSDDDGATWEPLETVGPAGPEVNGGWIHRAFLVADIANISNTATLRVRFNASDLNEGSVVEAALDRVEITALFCDDEIVPGDADGDGDVDFDDVLLILSLWGPVADCPPYIPADANQDCEVGFDDLLIALSNWTA